MKTIKPIKFSAEKEQNANVSQLPINRAQPSGSGSGGSEKSDNGFATGNGTISSNIGGSWSVSCSFSWNASLQIDTNAKRSILKSVRMYITNIAIGLNPINAGVKRDGSFYEPFSHNFVIPSKEHSEDAIDETSGIINVRFYISLPGKELKVTETVYNEKGEKVSSEIRSEFREIDLQFEYDYVDHPESLKLLECEIFAM